MPHNSTQYFNIGKSQVVVGRFTYGHDNLKIYQCGEGASLIIGKFCSLALDISVFLGGDHRTDWTTTFPFGQIFQKELGDEKTPGHPSTKGDIVIEDDVWIGTGATIMSGITIGCGAIIAANAHVTKDVKPYQIVAGNPSTVSRNRFDEEITDLLLELKWWALDLNDIRKIKHKLCAKPSKEILLEPIERYRR